MDPRTIAFYDTEPGRYAEMVARELTAPPPELARFAAALPAGGRVLDLGCGPGWAAAWLAARGFAVDATDASAGMAAEGRRRHGVEIRVEPFEALAADGLYDGVWCAFALLHETRDALPGHLARIARALKPGGILYLGMKEGAGEARDALGRRYVYVAAPELEAMLAGAGLVGVSIGRDRVRGCAGVVEPVLHAVARRPVGAGRAAGGSGAP